MWLVSASRVTFVPWVLYWGRNGTGKQNSHLSKTSVRMLNILEFGLRTPSVHIFVPYEYGALVRSSGNTILPFKFNRGSK